MAVNSMGSSLNVDSIVTSLMKPYQAKVSAVNKEISTVQSTISNLGPQPTTNNVLINTSNNLFKDFLFIFLIYHFLF